MNRKDRRAAFKRGELLPVTQVRELMIKSSMDTLNRSVLDYSAVMAYCLSEKLGFGKKRIGRFLEDLKGIFADIEANRLTVDDITKVLSKERGVVIR